jgi:hypothetical protein
LYSCNLKVSEQTVSHLVGKTAGVSAAFIKELMRRSAQYSIQAGRSHKLEENDTVQAIEEMLFAGGSLNRKLLGAVAAEAGGD